MLREALIRIAQQPQLRSFATHNDVARSMARRFVPGETLPEVIEVVCRLNSQGMTATLDHLGENVTTRDEAAEATREACRMLDAMAAAEVRSTVSLKLTQLGLDLSEDLAFANIRHVVAWAAQLNTFVRIDMEGSAYVARTLEVFFRLFAEYQNVGAVIQACLYRSQQDLERLIQVGARVRLVKGAYLEPPAVAYQDKAEVDANFARLMEVLLSRGTYPAIATHDAAIIAAARRYARQHGIDRGSWEFQMLYGIRRDLQAQLVDEGYNMRIYVPYGTYWYPYLTRRMAERPANVMFVLGNIAREAVAHRH